MTEKVAEKTVGFSAELTTEYEHNDPALPYIDRSPRDSDQTLLQMRSKPRGKFQVRADDVIDFIFPQTLQHPLAAGRLFSYGMYGPLDEGNNMRTGPRGAHKTSVWELDQMCLQVEREDIMAIYMKKRGDIGLLSLAEQESLIAQADAKLKRAAGKSMLPQISKHDVYSIFADLPRDADDCYSFHDVQRAIEAYREERISSHKLVYPKIASGEAASKRRLGNTAGTGTGTGTYTQDGGAPARPGQSLQKTGRRRGKVSASVACATMFQHNKGHTNPDVIKQTNKYLSKHAYKISDIDSSCEGAMTANVRLLREVEPRCKNPFLDPLTGRSTLGDWDDACSLRGSGMGSMVRAIPSSTTWKRSATLAPASLPT